MNFVDHHKYNSNKRSYYGIRNMSDKLCRENGLSVVVPGKGNKGKSYAECQAEKTGSNWKGKLKTNLDTTDTSYLPSVSTSAISLAVAVTIRIAHTVKERVKLPPRCAKMPGCGDRTASAAPHNESKKIIVISISVSNCRQSVLVNKLSRHKTVSQVIKLLKKHAVES